MNNQTHPLCEACDFEDGQNFMIIGALVYKMCNIHSEEYVEIYCNFCELYHYEPGVEEYCSDAQRRFLDLDDEPDTTQETGMEDIE
jgi:hypothetical protein